MSGVILLLITLFIIFSIFMFVKHHRIYKLVKNIPTPPAVFFFGHILDFRDPKHILDKFTTFVNKYNGVVRLWVFWYQSIVISDYKHVEDVLSTTKIIQKSEEYEYLEKWLGSGLLTSKPEKWKKTRKIITPTFHFQILEQFVDVFNSCSDILVEKLKQEVGRTSCNIYNYVTLCALDVICESAMGTKVNAQLNAQSTYVQSVKEVSRIVRERMFSPWKMSNLLFHLSSDYRKEKASLKILHGYTTTVIQTRRLALINGDDHKDGDVPKKKKRLAFLDLLLQSTLDGRPMTDYEIRQEVDTFMFEGHDTTASAISFAFYCLSMNQDIQKKAVEELKDIFGNDKNTPATYDQLQNMKYLDMVIKETLRLYPSVPFFGRTATEDTKFVDVILPKDVSLTIFAWGMHRDPKVYPDPEKFDPERFTLENQNKRGPFSYIPFSAGPRNCIGQRFAMLEMKSTISKVLRHYEILPVPGFKPILIPDLILKSLNGVEVAFKERHF